MRATVNKQNSGEAGFTLIETMMAAVFLFIVVLIVCQLFAVESEVFLLNEMQRNAEAQVGEVTARLSTQRRENIVNGRDRVIVPYPGVEAERPGGCAAWPCVIEGWDSSLPDNTDVFFAREWTVDATHAARNLYRVRVNIFRDTQAGQPVVSRETQIVAQ